MVDQNDENDKIGFTTAEALNRLHDDIEEVLLEYERKYQFERWSYNIISVFRQNYNIPLAWFPIVTTIYIIICLLLTTNYISCFILTLLLILIILFVIREENLRRTEIYRKIRVVLKELNLAKRLSKDWTPNNYPHICSPLSPCVTLQWTYRDGEIINLPWALLVRGDYIVLRPGQVSPGQCSEINGKRNFKCGETYGLLHPVEPPKKPTARSPLPDLICVMETTPYLENLRISLDDSSCRPPTVYNQHRHLLLTKCVQQYGFIFIWVVVMCAGCANFFDFSFEGNYRISTKELFAELPAAALIPILPLIFPFLWILLNLWGTAKLETLLSIPQPIAHSDGEKSFQEDLDTPTLDWEHVSLPSRQTFCNWIQLLKGNSDLLARSTNVVQIFGSITALCCIDKKGILSWPNPTAEKVFFLRDSADAYSGHSDNSSLESEESNNINNGAIAEVLDLTHDQHSPFKLEFDDHEWKNHITSLKPLGLAILVNTCCPLTQAHYAKFCGHVTAVAMLDKDLVPVTNRYAIVESSLNSFMHGRCLCELAKQIGFTQQARQIFNLEGQIASYRHLQPDVVRRDIRFARSLHLAAKVKVPFPHSLSVVIRETHDGGLQLLTQGTADLVLDCCDDYWDGKDLRSLGPQERKRAQDFYQRSALTAYCTAFAYRPLRHGISGVLAGTTGDIAYLELPPETKNRMEHVEKTHCDFERNPTIQHSISTDSLLFSDHKEEDIADVEGCFEMQCHQVFIGMVTMQYQAQNDIVQLVERLDRACVRFVHFSKENELRSRVFSEKMGLESGWNCHISLLSDKIGAGCSPKSGYNLDAPNTSANVEDDLENGDYELNRLLLPIGLESSKILSSSAPGAISNQENQLIQASSSHSSNESFEMQRKTSKDSAMECQTQYDENCHSLSILTDSTEQSAPVHFDMSNRAKLPRGIENIRPHLENVDNVPLLVSLFTDCSAGATREMLKIMQQYGEIVVCLGSSASNSNAEIFLQADCSIAVEPLYPQVCQDFPSYTEANIFQNRDSIMNQDLKKKWFKTSHQTRNSTISPIYLSRLLNSISCSISVCRDDPLSIVALIELSRRFSNGLWNCIQFWVCCGCSLTIMNTISSILAVPPMLTPFSSLYLMCIAVPAICVPLVRIQSDAAIMKRATGKKQTSLNSSAIIVVFLGYGCKFVGVILIMTLSYMTFISHPIHILKINSSFEVKVEMARIFILLSVVLHFITVSMSFVHREYSIWKKNPFSNKAWMLSSVVLLVLHTLICLYSILSDSILLNEMSNSWPVVLFLILSMLITFATTEFCKLEEIKANVRYQRRARLDFGTKLGMNSPF